MCGPATNLAKITLYWYQVSIKDRMPVLKIYFSGLEILSGRSRQQAGIDSCLRSFPDPRPGESPDKKNPTEGLLSSWLNEC